ncbi:MAG: GNAT family N-acetyltransferase [Dehalococcoidales bacterium]|nr:MAG: GNAT family N-acetyltransferase [Dehalococcoidales bacterium]
MDVKTYTKAADFLSAAYNILQSDEARYGLIYGIARRVEVNPYHYGNENPWFCIVNDKDGISTLAWRTPPYQLGLAWYTGNAEEAVSLLIKAVRKRWKEIPGVVGHREVTDSFAERWSYTYGVPIESTMAQRIYRLDSVNDVPFTSGRMRLATLADKDLATSWVRAFSIDIGEYDRNPPNEDITPRIEMGEIYLWEDNGKPVSMVGKARSTEHGITIGPVYTPLELRRHGYATACVAHVCGELLKSGYEFCTLYTDLSNPTSNSIYMKVGFKPVCDSVQYGFSVPNR